MNKPILSHFNIREKRKGAPVAVATPAKKQKTHEKKMNENNTNVDEARSRAKNEKENKREKSEYYWLQVEKEPDEADYRSSYEDYE